MGLNERNSMAKRGRKPKNERKGYFYEKEEEAIIHYINEENVAEKNRTFNEILYPALTKMIESIIRRYKLYVRDEEFDQTFSDTISYLLTKISNFKPTAYVYEKLDDVTDDPDEEYTEVSEYDYQSLYKNPTEESPKLLKVLCGASYDEPYYEYYRLVMKKYKAYSYCGTVCKHYLIQKNVQLTREQRRVVSYDFFPDSLNELNAYPTDDSGYKTAEKLIKQSSCEIKKMLDDPVLNDLNEDEIKVGKALVYLLDNWETVLIGNESNKLQKSSVLYFLREQTMMETKELRENMTKYKDIYYILKDAELKL